VVALPEAVVGLVMTSRVYCWFKHQYDVFDNARKVVPFASLVAYAGRVNAIRVK